MYKLNVTSSFSAAHKLVGYDGACQNLHGHNWKVRVEITCKETNEIGLTIDFGIVKKHLNNLIDKLDHKYLNDIEYFRNNNPTSENIAKFLFNSMKKFIDNDNSQISAIEIWESEKSSMIYFE